MAKKSEDKVLAAKPTASEDKLKALGLAMQQITKEFGDGSIMKLGEAKHVDVETIPSGALSLDIALGGGYPKGRIIEIYGPESSGKTTLTLHAIAEVQKQGGTAAFIDAEHALDPAYAKRLGVDTENLLVSQPDNGEQALEIVETLVRSNAVDLVVVDSVAALVPQAEIEGDMGDAHMGLQARLMSQALRKLTGIIDKSKTTVFFINQIRMKIGVMFGNPETTTGGNALKFYASVRADIRRTGQIKEGDEIIFFRIMKGNIFGEMAFFDHTDTYAVNKALSKGRYAVVNRQFVEKKLEENPEVYHYFLISIIRKYRAVMSELANSHFNDSTGRVADFLVRMYYTEDGEDKSKISIIFTHEEIANRLGLNRITVTNTMNLFKDKGYIDVKNRKIIIKDIEALKQITNILLL